MKQAALDYHEFPRPGKISTKITKPTETQQDLCLAYTPGVAEPVRAIARDPEAAYRYTSKGNLVAVISDGTAVLGLGNVGALAGKPVMEGKGVLFKRFADVDVFDIEVTATNPQDFINTVTNISPTFEIPSPYMMSNSAVLKGGATLFLTIFTFVRFPKTLSPSLI